VPQFARNDQCGARSSFVCKCFMPAVIEIVGWVEVRSSSENMNVIMICHFIPY